ncbi:MAG: hypothetical protein H6566_06065 [Lewinellaceae bacterium]|nr:hypothetical protein [Lewinellaceae bacterium]
MAQGFPDKMRACFKGVADNLNGVVSTRVPGGATTQLIEERHDLKGYFIKAKSCNCTYVGLSVPPPGFQ